ncbi:HD domain-containing phosphohydrolase [Pontiella agarivorans]|uniref:Response regulator n=1 Tax=Pontiella agarivorans TaxID=3038953 RepID=A0ABU5MSU7_9BACT|nr:HD domain-containing phosphohydrolase [Pontiella agarivorans]MDZ8117275.1 response regulator [Pontiella agarivorans]
MKNQILFVDDEQNVLDGIRRQLRRQFEIDTALGPDEGLRYIEEGKSYAVVVSDMRMPGMDGISFLNRVAQLSPFTVRMMLTGNADQKTASDAVNKGNIFRFMNKPCPTETMSMHLKDALLQFELVHAEKELLEKTLKGSIEVLVEILALTNPVAFSRAERIKYYMSQCVLALGRHDLWKFEVAAMFSQMGYVTIPTDIMEKSFAGMELTDTESAMITEHAKDTHRMIDKIPRLEDVGKMIEVMDSDDCGECEGDVVALGGQLLRTIIEFDRLMLQGARPYQALHTMRQGAVPFNERLLKLLEEVQPPQIEKTVKCIHVQDLHIGMVLAEDIRNTSNTLIVSKGQSVNGLMQRHLGNFLRQKTIGEKIRVYEERQVFTV